MGDIFSEARKHTTHSSVTWLGDRPRADIGTMTDQVALQKRGVIEPFAKVWSRVSTQRRSDAGTHIVVMRFRTDIGEGDRIIFRGRALEVLGSSDLNGRRVYSVFVCKDLGSTK